MNENNVILAKTYAFAIRIVKLYQYLIINKKEYVLSRQLLKSGTSIGANCEEAIGGQSTKDFLAKIQISYKEARETHYWIRLLRDAEILTERQSVSLLTDLDEIIKILTSILKTTKQKLSENKKI